MIVCVFTKIFYRCIAKTFFRKCCRIGLFPCGFAGCGNSGFVRDSCCVDGCCRVALFTRHRCRAGTVIVCPCIANSIACVIPAMAFRLNDVNLCCCKCLVADRRCRCKRLMTVFQVRCRDIFGQPDRCSQRLRIIAFDTGDVHRRGIGIAGFRPRPVIICRSRIGMTRCRNFNIGCVIAA